MKGRVLLSRRVLIVDTAISMVGTGGMRRLTHRIVDELAGIPTGSVCNFHKTRSGLVNATAARIHEIVSATSEQMVAGQRTEIDYCTDLLNKHRHLFRALTVLSLDPKLPETARTQIDNALACVTETVTELSGLSSERARTVIGRLTVQLMQATRNALALNKPSRCLSSVIDSSISTARLFPAPQRLCRTKRSSVTSRLITRSVAPAAG